MTFISHVVPAKLAKGKAAFLDSTRRFYAMIAGIDVTTLLVEGDRACALTRYKLQAPQRPSFDTEVAEIFRIVDGKMAPFEIYFDSAPFPK